MYQIRHGVFETNSSSTHSLCICTEDEFTDFKCNKAMWDKNTNKIVPTNKITRNYVQRAKEYYTKQQTSFMKDWDSLSPESQLEFIVSEFDKSYAGDWLFEEKTFYKDWGTGFERFESHFTTPSGDKMVAFGEYGYDG